MRRRWSEPALRPVRELQRQPEQVPAQVLPRPVLLQVSRQAQARVPRQVRARPQAARPACPPRLRRD